MTEQDAQTAQAVVQSITDDGTLDDLRVQLTKQLKQHVSLVPPEMLHTQQLAVNKASEREHMAVCNPALLKDLPCTCWWLSCGSTWKSWC